MVAAYPFFTDFYGRQQQKKLQEAYFAAEDMARLAQDAAETEPATAGAAGLEIDPEIIWGFIEIPAIDLAAVVLRGTSRARLWRGPGWCEQSALPGEGNTVITGHRSMYGAWFRRVDRLRPGDTIILRYQGYPYRYRVEKTFVVAKNDWSVTEPCGYPALTLTTCHPFGSDRQRLVVRAALLTQ